MKGSQNPEKDSLSRRKFVQQSVLGAAGLGLLLKDPSLAREVGNRRFFRADELTPEDRIRWRSMKAQRFDEGGGGQPAKPIHSGDKGGTKHPGQDVTGKVLRKKGKKNQERETE